MQFFFIITLSQNEGNHIRTATISGTLSAQPGKTRADLFSTAFSYAQSKTGLTSPVVAFFDLAPNELPTAVPAVPSSSS